MKYFKFLNNGLICSEPFRHQIIHYINRRGETKFGAFNWITPELLDDDWIFLPIGYISMDRFFSTYATYSTIPYVYYFRTLEDYTEYHNNETSIRLVNNTVWGPGEMFRFIIADRRP